MTEAEWQTAANPLLMLEAFPRHASDRKLRLFACACCRSVWHLLSDPRSRRAVEVAERYADGAAGDNELLAAARDANEASHPVGAPLRHPDHGARHAAHLATYAPHTLDAFVNPPAHARPQSGGYSPEAFAQADGFACLACIIVADVAGGILAGATGYANREAGQEAELRRQSGVVRDLFGNPFRPAAFEAAWRTEHTVGIAAKMYEVRDFAAMPILADALQEAGCEDEAILSHCREPGEHVRGCWVVDLVLGKV